MTTTISEDEDTATVAYVRLMALLAERSLGPWLDGHGLAHPKLTTAQRRHQCERWARQCGATRPQLAGYLREAAAQFAKTAGKEV